VPGRSPPAASARPRARARICRPGRRARSARATRPPGGAAWPASTPFISSAKAMFSQTVISGKRARFWKISAVGRLFGPIRLMSLPSIRTAPRGRAQKAGDSPEDRGLAAARGAEKAEEFTGLDAHSRRHERRRNHRTGRAAGPTRRLRHSPCARSARGRYWFMKYGAISCQKRDGGTAAGTPRCPTAAQAARKRLTYSARMSRTRASPPARG
jgi:hypothetical protein